MELLLASYLPVATWPDHPSHHRLCIQVVEDDHCTGTRSFSRAHGLRPVVHLAVRGCFPGIFSLTPWLKAPNRCPKSLGVKAKCRKKKWLKVGLLVQKKLQHIMDANFLFTCCKENTFRPTRRKRVKLSRWAKPPQGFMQHLRFKTSTSFGEKTLGKHFWVYLPLNFLTPRPFLFWGKVPMLQSTDT